MSAVHTLVDYFSLTRQSKNIVKEHTTLLLNDVDLPHTHTHTHRSLKRSAFRVESLSQNFAEHEYMRNESKSAR